MSENITRTAPQHPLPAFEEKEHEMTETSETSTNQTVEEQATVDSVFDVDDLAVYYGAFKAVREVSLKIRPHEIAAFIGPSGCGKSTVLRCFNRMNDTIMGARVEGSIKYHGVDLYGPNVSATQVRRHIGMVFQKPNPFPKSIYDNVAYGPRIAGGLKKSELDDVVEESLRGAALWEEVKGRLKSSGLGSIGRATATAVHRSSAGGATGSDPDGRAVFCTRPDRHGTHRGPDARDQGALHHRHRHAQHAAGRAHQRPGGIFHDRGVTHQRSSHRCARGVRTGRRRCSPTPPTSAPRRMSPGGSARSAHM